MNRSEELIACLESEIVRRDIRIDELEAGVVGENRELEILTAYCEQLRAELAALREPDCDRGVCGDFSPGRCDNPDCSARRDRASAPVAKPHGVMPERIPIAGHLTAEQSYRASGRNACLDECARLNAAEQEGGQDE
jgi:hypothetical protein